jgi:hypothetical protein
MQEQNRILAVLKGMKTQPFVSVSGHESKMAFCQLSVDNMVTAVNMSETYTAKFLRTMM